LVHFSRFGTLHQEKSGNPGLNDDDFGGVFSFSFEKGFF
jgi:hypothetical protein